jgi:hypothetical protein
VIGPFPWDPFPHGEPDPKGPDPVHSLAFRSAVTAADAYHAVRLAVRREAGTLRIGNRFVLEGRYREVAFLAFGNAANSMALGALHAVGQRLTQGFLAGPEPVAADVPFRGVVVPPGWPGSPIADAAVQAAVELAAGLTEEDLLLLLLSPGALGALAGAPPGMTLSEFGRLLEQAHARGATGREVGLVTRVLGTGAVGGRLAAAVPRADLVSLVVERGDGPTVVGGGPTQPVDPVERVEVRSILSRTDLLSQVPSAAQAMLPPNARDATRARAVRPVVVASPSDGLRAASDAVFDKGWTVRLAFLELREGPEVAAERFLERSETLYQGEALTSDSRTKGVATFAMATLGLPEGLDEGPALGRFLSRAQELLRRREMSVGLFRTGGDARATPAFPPGAVVGTPTEPDDRVTPGRARAVRMRAGVTDVGCLAVALYPRPAAA